MSIALPDGSITLGKITQVATVATSSSSSSPGSGSGSPGSSSNSSPDGSNGSSGPGTATVNVYVSLDHPEAAGKLNQAPVTVTITESSVTGVLVVPVDALLAQPHGQYAVEVATSGHGHRLVTVTPGLFDDAAGLVQVTGNLTPGQRVVVPGL